MAVRRSRLDAELVRRGLARSREHASQLIESGVVRVGGAQAGKAATGVTTDAAITLSAKVGPQWASRGAHKLLGALEAFGPHGLSPDGKRCLDAGASTGGFTDVLLKHGAREVVAVDVGYGQLVWTLQSDPRVHVLDRQNVREITPELVGGPVDLVVGDLSFISLTLVLEPLIGVTTPTGDLCLMVKPQFEVGKDKVGKGGVVRDLGHRVDTVWRVATASEALGWGAQAVITSPLPGPSGNIEFFLWLRAGAGKIDEGGIRAEVERSALWGQEGAPS